MDRVKEAKKQLMEAIKGLKSGSEAEEAKAALKNDLDTLIKATNSDRGSKDLEFMVSQFQNGLTDYARGVELKRHSTHEQLKLISEKAKLLYSSLNERVGNESLNASGSDLQKLAATIKRDAKIQALQDGMKSIDGMMEKMTEQHYLQLRNPDYESNLASDAKTKVEDLPQSAEAAKTFVTESAETVIANQGSRTPTDVLLSKFLDTYADKLKSDFKSIGSQHRKSRLAFPEKGGVSSQRLIAAIHHAAFNGGRRTEAALRKAGVLAKHGWKPNPNLPSDQQEAVSAALKEARVIAGKQPKGDRVLERRIKQFDKSMEKSNVRPSAFRSGLKDARADAKGRESGANKDDAPSLDDFDAQDFGMGN